MEHFRLIMQTIGITIFVIASLLFWISIKYHLFTHLHHKYKTRKSKKLKNKGHETYTKTRN